MRLYGCDGCKQYCGLSTPEPTLHWAVCQSLHACKYLVHLILLTMGRMQKLLGGAFKLVLHVACNCLVLSLMSHLCHNCCPSRHLTKHWQFVKWPNCTSKCKLKVLAASLLDLEQHLKGSTSMLDDVYGATNLQYYVRTYNQIKI